MNATILHEKPGAYPAEAEAEADDASTGRSFGSMAAGKSHGSGVPSSMNVPVVSFCIMKGRRQAMLDELRHFSWKEGQADHCAACS